MDLTSNDLYYTIKKKINEKKDKNKKPVLPSISITKRLEMLKQQKKEESIEKYFKGIILNESNIANFIFNTVNPKIIKCFHNLEYLSITNNYLINLNFIINIPDLFYLDVYGNPLDEFSALNYKNIFGYLRLSVDKFHENKILTVTGLNCAILDIEIKDKNILKMFKSNNKNILMMNNKINYYIDKLSDRKRKIFKPKKTIKFFNNNYTMNDNGETTNKNNKFFKLNFNDFIKQIEEAEKDSKNNSEISDKSILDLDKNENYKIDEINNNNFIINNNIKIEIKNKFLLDIKNYFDELNQVLTKISKKLKTKISVNYLYKEDMYLNIEKKRILLLYQTYLKLSIFNKEKTSDYFYCKNPNSINGNKFTDTIRVYEIKKYIKCININIRFGIIILISILFYCLNLISMKLSISIIYYILLKHYKFDEHKQIPKIKNFGDFHYLCYYIDNFEDFKTKLKFAEKSQIDLYQKILDILEIKNLILKSNFLKQKKEENENENKNLMDDISQKNKVSSLLLLIKELNIDKDILILIEFFCDFIIYENIEQVVINGAMNDEYSMLIEIKEILEMIEFGKKNSNINDLSNKKYYKNKLERIFNKFYFENDKIKIIKNKNFKNLEDNKINFSSTKFNLLSFILNWNKDYMKTDQINIQNCLSIDKIKGNNKNQKYFINSKEKYITNNKCLSEEKKNIKNPSQTSFNIITSDKINNNNEIKKIHYKTIYNNSYTNNSGDKINMKMTTNSKSHKNYNNIDTKDSLFNNKVFTFKELFQYFDYNKRKEKIKLKNINNKKYIKNYFLNTKINQNLKVLKNNKTDKYYNTLNNNNDIFPFNCINKEDAKLKIKQIDNDVVSINAHRLYWKKKYSHSRENIQIYNENFSEGLLVEKYNQEKQAKIIRKIIENKNKIINEKINENKKIK